MKTDYEKFLAAKEQGGAETGFKPVWMPDFLFDFQAAKTEWAIRKGHGANVADCGLGKTPICRLRGRKSRLAAHPPQCHSRPD